MAIFLTENSKLLVQGITGSEGTKHTIRMLGSHANIVAGVTPGKGGQTVTAEGRDIPVFNSCQEAVAATGADVSVVFVPPKFAKAAWSGVDAAIPVVVITEGIAIHDTAFPQYAATPARRGSSARTAPA
jgi:succinyl-CoA synthetase alpha subunit